jgi:hypothetical protein
MKESLVDDNLLIHDFEKIESCNEDLKCFVLKEKLEE